jgi:hypothetical protein
MMARPRRWCGCAGDVPAGTDHVVFRFRGYGGYPALFALSGLTLAMAGAGPACVLYARRRRAEAGSGVDAEGVEDAAQT